MVEVDANRMASTGALTAPVVGPRLSEEESEVLGWSRSTRATNGILAAIAVVSSVGLLPWLNKPMFRDEASSLYAAHLSWGALWQQSRVVDLVVLPYYSFLHLWIQLSPNIEWVRFLSLFAFGLTVFLVGHLGVRLGGSWCGVLAAALAATNPLMVQAALYARPYALSALASTAAVIALIRWLGGGGVRWAWWFCLASVAALLLQMFAVLVPFSVLVAAVAVRPNCFRRQRRSLVVPIGLLSVLTLSFVALGARQRGQIAWISNFFHRRQLITNLLGPAYGGSGVYAIAIVAIVLVSIALCLRGWRRGGIRPARLDLECFAICSAWAVLPTVIMVIVSFVDPVYVDRYVTASAPGLAIAIALLIVRGFDVVAARWVDWSRAIVGTAALGIAAAVIVSACSIPAAQAVSENFQLAAKYLTVHVGLDGESAMADHSLTTAVDYYLRVSNKTVRTWPQLTVQPYINGFDLGQDRQDQSRAPNNVWLVDDRLGPSTTGFIAMLTKNGYVRSGTARLPGVLVEHFRRTTNLDSQSRSGSTRSSPDSGK